MQTNMLPNHCTNAINENAEEFNVDYAVIFNRDVNGVMNYSESDLDSAAKTEELLCDIQRTADANMMDANDFTTYSAGRRLQGGKKPPKGDGPPPDGDGPGGAGLLVR